MNKIQSIQRLCNQELVNQVAPTASWHHEYADSAYIYVGGLSYNLNEGDLAMVFSQFGEVTDVHLRRDPETGTSKGFAFIAYENQISTNLAVDNLNGITLEGRPICVDHVKEFRPPKEHKRMESRDEAKQLQKRREGRGGRDEPEEPPRKRQK